MPSCRMYRALLLAVTTAVATGCATPNTVRVDFVSDPPGAMIFSGAQRIGVAPISLRIDRPAEFSAGGCTRSAASLTANWVSGAETRIESPLCAAQGSHQVFVFKRPIAAGAQADAEYALKLKTDALFQQRGDASANAIESVAEPLTGWPPQPQPRR